VGLLKQEMRDLGSPLMSVAEQTKVPAGKALAVDRDRFGTELTQLVESEPLIRLIRRPVDSLDAPELADHIVVLAAGPLIPDNLAASLAIAIGDTAGNRLYFYDAIAPIVNADSVDMTIAFRGSRYGKDAPPPYADDAPFRKQPSEPDAADPGTEEGGDYLNCPMTKAEYEAFYQALLKAEKVPAHNFEQEIHFEGCLPIETLAERGERTLTFGSLKPVGFTDPRTGRRPYALLQLRAENTERTAYNLVGCQTKMTYSAQDRVFRLVPGLKQAEFLRFGSVHRNTYVNAPVCLAPDLSLLARPHIHLAGQITGVEGYVESAACGLWLGLLLAVRSQNRSLPPPPAATALGALLQHLRTPSKQFQPSNIHFGLMPELPERPHKKARKVILSERAREDFAAWQKNAEVC
jgi:methylenetetrahydrofolate--tRNA-(uracil-5-)-methyltransferase